MLVRMISNVAVLAFDGVAPFELGVLHEAWGYDRSDEGLPVFDFAICAPQGRPVSTSVPVTTIPARTLTIRAYGVGPNRWLPFGVGSGPAGRGHPGGFTPRGAGRSTR